MDLLIEWSWQGLVLAVGVMALADRWPRASAATRYQVGWLALGVVVGLPLVHLAPDGPAAGNVFAAAAPDGGLVSIDPVPSIVVAAGLCAWGLWTLVSAARLVLALAALRRVRAASRPFPRALEARLTVWTQHRHRARAARLVLSDDVAGASVLGLWSPLIAVSPEVTARLTPAELDRIVVHELAHVARRDDWTELAQVIVRALVGWHPAVWWLDRRLRAEREAASDDWVVALTDEAIPYAASLVKLAELQRSIGRPLRLALGVLGRSRLSARVERLLDARLNRSIRGSRPVVATFAVIAIGLGLRLSAIDLVAAPTASTPPAVVGHERISPDAERQPRGPASVGLPAAAQPAGPPAAADAIARRRTGTMEAAGAPADRAAAPRVQPETDRPAREPSVTEATGPVSPSAPEPGITASPLGSHVLNTLPASPAPVAIAAESDRSSDEPLTPWGAAADGGVAIGEGSRKAAVATAGFFTRLGKSIGGAF